MLPSSIEPILHWIEFLLFMWGLSPVHKNTTRVMNIKKKFVFHFAPAAPALVTGGKNMQVCNSAWITSVPWAPRMRAWVVLVAEQKKCFCACLRLGEGSWPGHCTSILSLAMGVGGGWRAPGEAQVGGILVLGGRAAAAVFGFPLVPGI